MIKIKSNAGSLYWASISHQGQWAPSYQQRMYYETLKFCEGKELLSCRLVDSKEPCAHLPADVTCFHYKPTESKVIALPPEFVEYCDDRHTDPPVEPRECSGPDAWWKKPEHDFDVVRVLTAWVDGFIDFTRCKASISDCTG